VRYAGEVAFVDRHLGGLLANVDRAVGMGRTLLVLAADHGEEFGEHGGAFHAVTLYDEVARVPLWFVGASLPPRRVDAAVSLADVAPTVLDLLGLPPLPATDGRSLAAAMTGGRVAPRAVLAESVRYGRAVRSVVDGPFKLIYEARAGTYELFDLAHDPGEARLVGDAHRDDVARLAAEMGVPAP
jgi:arylsulfatase A-like enzyme